MCSMRALPLALLLAACPPSQQEVDEPAANLDLSLAVVDTDPTPADGMVAVIAQFELSGEVVDLDGAATVTCNGVALENSGIGFEGRVPLLAAGGSYTFVHTRRGTATTVTVSAPPRPVVVTPAAGAHVTRTKSLSVTYQPGSGSGVRASAGDDTTGVLGSNQPDTGTYTGLDVTSLHPGAGTVGIIRDVATTPAGTGFKSARSTVSVASVDVPVTWL
jgi:hypothetical protein